MTMPETAQRTSATSTTTIAPAAPESKPNAAPEVLSLVGTTIKGDGQFEYRVLADATFEVIKIPPGTKPEVMGRKLRPDNEYKDAWQKLTDRIVAEAKAKAPPVTTQPSAPTKTPVVPAEPSLGTMILDGIASVGEELSGMVDAGAAWLEEFLLGPSAPATDTEAPAAEAPAAEKPPAAADPAAAQGKQDNIQTAVDLMGELDQKYELYTKDSGTTVKTGIIGGNAQDLTTLNCGQFTAAVLGEAGYDLNKEWIDPGTGLPIAYVDGSAKEKGTSVTFVTAFMMINAQPEAIASVLDAQKGPIADPKNPAPTDATAKVTKVEGDACANYTLATNVKQNSRFKTADGAESAPAVQPSARGAFLVTTSKNFVGMKAEDGQAFGAGAAAQLFGGEPVSDPTKRMPGDIQQRLDVNKEGTFTGAGHSSTVYAVKGTGTCYFDPNGGSAKPADGKLDRAAGWYTGLWIVDSTTDPKHVSTFSLTEVQMIDANTNEDLNGKARTQAVAIGSFYKPKGAESIGRLPTSHWLGWKDGNVSPVEPKPL